MQPLYQATQRFIHEFEQEFGARGCTELLGCDLGAEEGQVFFKLHELKQTRCALFVARAAELAAQIGIETGMTQS